MNPNKLIAEYKASLNDKEKVVLEIAETKLETSPPSLWTSLTKFEEINEFFSDVIRNIVSINGSYTNIIGLPVAQVLKKIKEIII